MPNYFEKSCPDLTYLRFYMSDNDSEDLTRWLDRSGEFLHSARVRGDGAVLVHCRLGQSRLGRFSFVASHVLLARSVSIVLGYLIMYCGMDYVTALCKVRAARPEADPIESFVTTLKGLAVREVELPPPPRRKRSPASTPATGGSARAAIGPELPLHLRRDISLN